MLLSHWPTGEYHRYKIWDRRSIPPTAAGPTPGFFFKVAIEATPLCHFSHYAVTAPQRSTPLRFAFSHARRLRRVSSRDGGEEYEGSGT